MGVIAQTLPRLPCQLLTVPRKRQKRYCNLFFNCPNTPNTSLDFDIRQGILGRKPFPNRLHYLPYSPEEEKVFSTCGKGVEYLTGFQNPARYLTGELFSKISDRNATAATRRGTLLQHALPPPIPVRHRWRQSPRDPHGSPIDSAARRKPGQPLALHIHSLHCNTAA